MTATVQPVAVREMAFPTSAPPVSRTRLSHTETAMNCIHCHGKMSRSTVPFHVDRAGYHLSFDTIPAWICNQCGEAYFEEREVNAIQTAVYGLDRQARQLSAHA